MSKGLHLTLRYDEAIIISDGEDSILLEYYVSDKLMPRIRIRANPEKYKIERVKKKEGLPCES